MNKTIAEWLTHFETLHPLAIDMGLSRVAHVWDTLCTQYSIEKIANHKIITVAGTNGKGSACKILELIISAQDASVGMYTSPHIHDVNERIQINGKSIDDDTLCKAFAAIEKARQDTSLSYFEVTTLAGLLCFAWARVDYSILEVGLGGRLDAINIIDADATLITSIGRDHETFLGSDVSQIVLEKAGICRPHKPCIYADNELYSSLLHFIDSTNIPLIANHRDYHIRENTVTFKTQTFTIPQHIANHGKHQISNCAGVLVLLKSLELLPDDYQEALTKFYLPGRLQKISNTPDVIVDVAHNEDSALALSQHIKQIAPQYRNIHAIIAMLADKDHVSILSAFKEQFDTITVSSTRGERGLSSTALMEIAQTIFCHHMNESATLEQALQQAQEKAHPNDLIIAFGSFIVAHELI